MRCVYCGWFCAGPACSAHDDLPTLDPYLNPVLASHPMQAAQAGEDAQAREGTVSR
jgi:hypothetical protein